MIRFGLRLTVSGGKEALARLLITASAVALGVGLLLTTLAAINATNAQNDRYAWFNSGFVSSTSPADAASRDPLWWQLGEDKFHGQLLGRVEVAATGANAPVPPGIPHLPGPGQYYASPALAKLIAAMPANQLADRFPGTLVGAIGNSALPSPNSLVVIIGRTPDQLAQMPAAKQITGIASTSPGSCSDCRVGRKAEGIDLILSVAAAALVFPVLILIGTATRLSATRREQRFAAMRLVGATPRQISVISAVESTVAAVGGVAVGFLLFLLLRAPMAKLPFTGDPFFPSDLTLGIADVLLVVLGVPVAATVAARLALRRVQISPLGVTRRVTPRPPRAWRVIPLVAGLAELGYFVGRRPATVNGQIQAYLSGFLLTMAGLIIAGPWLTMAGSRVMARRTNRPAVLIAGRRLSDNPKAGFRAVSGLILALFVTSATVGIITTMTARRSLPPDGPVVRNIVTQDFTHGYEDSGEPTSARPPFPDHVLTDLRAIPGVQSVVVIHSNPLGTKVREDHSVAGLVSCAELAQMSGFGHCEPGAAVAAVTPSVNGWDEATYTWPTAAITADRLAGLPVVSLAVGTNGDNAAIEHARTLLITATPGERAPATVGESRADQSAQFTGFQQLADVVLLASLPIAGCSLAVSVAGGLSERKRPFSLLRLTGVPLAMLRRVVALESVVPLLVSAVVATGTGFLAAHLFLKAQLGYALVAPGGEYYVIVVAGLAASLGIIAATLPLLKRITGPETARNE